MYINEQISGYLQNLDPDSKNPGSRNTWTLKNMKATGCRKRLEDHIV